MKKRKGLRTAALVGGVLISSTLLQGCVGPNGPGKDRGEDRNRSDPEYQVEYNMNACLYGPPENFDYDTSADSVYRPEDNIPEEVYGPPSFYEDEPDEEVPEEEEAAQRQK